MMILITIILIFLGILSYIFASKRDVTNDWLCMLGFILMPTGAIIIGMLMDGTL